jgi:hypothetical protein
VILSFASSHYFTSQDHYSSINFPANDLTVFLILDQPPLCIYHIFLVFISCRASGLFLKLGYCAQSFNKHWCASDSVVSWITLLRYMSRSAISGLVVALFLVFFEEPLDWFPYRCANLHSHQNSSFPPSFSPALDVRVFDDSHSDWSG